jgi:hypothetical protein
MHILLHNLFIMFLFCLDKFLPVYVKNFLFAFPGGNDSDGLLNFKLSPWFIMLRLIFFIGDYPVSD